jgi:signal transduction histidine kinase
VRHGGRIEARNVEDGGLEVVVALPLAPVRA